MRLCFVVPRLPPAIDGVGDHCRQLWKHWWEDADASSQRIWEAPYAALVLEGAEASRVTYPDVTIDSFSPSQPGLIHALESVASDVVILHYVGYGFDSKGAPRWLPDALEAWKSAQPGRKVAVMFHETWAEGKPWQRAFW